MKQLFNPACQLELTDRIRQLTLNHMARWGEMNVGQMVCHCTDPLREALGLRPTKDMSNLLSRTVFKWASLFLLNKWPEGKLPTSPEYNQQISGTTPTTFEKDKEQLLRLLETVCSQPNWYRFQPHPFFGNLSRKELGVLVYKHLDHHLRQFGA
ncbi:MAG: hypothetical protein RL021_1413 [Bacteroidota bacterium]|jgi:hypothetical protein